MAHKHAFLPLRAAKSMKNRFWGRNFDFWKKFRNSFWGCRVVETHSLGSGKWFGTTLDHLECSRSDFKEKKFVTFFQMFLKHFQRILACFWRILAVRATKNQFFWKVSHVWKIEETKSFIWSHSSLLWYRLAKNWKLRDKLGSEMKLKTRFLRL